jgi:hypothetical protein
MNDTFPDQNSAEDTGVLAEISSWWTNFSAAWRPDDATEAQPNDETATENDDDPALLDTLREQVASLTVSAIRAVSLERDRADIVKWFADAEAILGDDEKGLATKAAELYAAVNTRHLASILANTARTALTNYTGSDLPLGLKVAMPVAAGGLAILGAQGAGIAAFGSAIGLPVALLLFLGTAGAMTVVEAFVRDPAIRDPLTRLLMAMVAAEASRRIDKELLKAMRADAALPQRAEVPSEHSAILNHLVSMDPFDFERHVMSFFEDMGHPAGVTPKTNDGGFDGYVVHPDGLVLVQCKRYAPGNHVGGPEVQQVMGVVQQNKAHRAYVVTTSGFTRGAISAAAASDQVILIDGPELVQWHVENQRTR